MFDRAAGASQGIGKATAVAFHQHGATVCFIARRLPLMQACIDEELSGGDDRAFAFEADVTDRARFSQVIRDSV